MGTAPPPTHQSSNSYELTENSTHGSDAHEQQKQQIVALDFDSRYKCCCNALPATNGALVFAIIQCIFAIVGVFVSFMIALTTLPSSVALLISSVLIFVAYNNENPKLYFASLIIEVIHIVLSLIQLLVTIVFCILVVYEVIAPGYQYWKEKYFVLLVSASITTSIINSIFFSWFFYVLARAYSYAKAKRQLVSKLLMNDF